MAAPLAPGSPLHDAVAAQLAGLGVAAAAESGTLLLLWGGYNTHNAQFGGPDIQVPAVLATEPCPPRRPEAAASIQET